VATRTRSLRGAQQSAAPNRLVPGFGTYGCRAVSIPEIAMVKKYPLTTSMVLSCHAGKSAISWQFVVNRKRDIDSPSFCIGPPRAAIARNHRISMPFGYGHERLRLPTKKEKTWGFRGLREQYHICPICQIFGRWTGAGLDAIIAAPVYDTRTIDPPNLRFVLP